MIDLGVLHTMVRWVRYSTSGTVEGGTPFVPECAVHRRTQTKACARNEITMRGGGSSSRHDTQMHACLCLASAPGDLA